MQLPTFPEELSQIISRRRAQVLLNQLYTETSPMFYPLSKVLGNSTGLCEHCHMKETVQHFFHCPHRARSRRALFRTRQPWREKVVGKPIEVLMYLSREGVLAARS